jgi:hypothetical protein
MGCRIIDRAIEEQEAGKIEIDTSELCPGKCDTCPHFYSDETQIQKRYHFNQNKKKEKKRKDLEEDLRKMKSNQLIFYFERLIESTKKQANHEKNLVRNEIRNRLKIMKKLDSNLLTQKGPYNLLPINPIKILLTQYTVICPACGGNMRETLISEEFPYIKCYGCQTKLKIKPKKVVVKGVDKS